MSTDVYEGPGLMVVRFVGPSREGPDRQRWQFTPLVGSQATLTRDEVLRLVQALTNDVAESMRATAAAARRG